MAWKAYIVLARRLKCARCKSEAAQSIGCMLNTCILFFTCRAFVFARWNVISVTSSTALGFTEIKICPRRGENHVGSVSSALRSPSGGSIVGIGGTSTCDQIRCLFEDTQVRLHAQTSSLSTCGGIDPNLQHPTIAIPQLFRLDANIKSLISYPGWSTGTSPGIQNPPPRKPSLLWKLFLPHSPN